MAANSFDPQKASLSQLRTQLGIANERLEHKEKEICQLKQALDLSHADLKQKEIDLKEVLKELNDLKVQIEVMKERFNGNKKKASIKLQALFASLLFLFASLLSSFGTNMLTSNPPDAKGTLLISLACIAYALAAFMTIFILGGDSQ